MRRRSRERPIVGLLFALPALVVYALFVLGPIVHAAILSFFEWNGITKLTFVGFDNYLAIFADERLRGSFANSGVLIFFFSILPMFAGLLLTGLMSRRPLRGLGAIRAILFLPQVVASVVIGMAWRWLYSIDGPINQLLIGIGVLDTGRTWLGDFGTALPAVGFIGAWVLTGLTTVLFMAGVQKIPREIYDAAKVDGAGPVREFLTVTIPGLRREITLALALTVMISLKAFDLIFVTTKGGPGWETSVPGFEIYYRAFIALQVGQASAIGMVLTLIVLAVSFIILRVGERGENEKGGK